MKKYHEVAFVEDNDNLYAAMLLEGNPMDLGPYLMVGMNLYI